MLNGHVDCTNDANVRVISGRRRKKEETQMRQEDTHEGESAQGKKKETQLVSSSSLTTVGYFESRVQLVSLVNAER